MAGASGAEPFNSPETIGVFTKSTLLSTAGGEPSPEPVSPIGQLPMPIWNPTTQRRSGNWESPAWVELIPLTDRKSTRLNSSHVEISYAVFCLKKKKNS